MKKIIQILIVSVALLSFTHPKTAPTQASKVAPRKTQNLRPMHLTVSEKSESSETNWWAIECVDCPKDIKKMSDRSLQMDAEGDLHIAYGGNHLYYAWQEDGEWYSITVDGAPNVGSGASLALDEEGYPHISYIDGIARGDIKYAFKDSTGWHFMEIQSDTPVVMTSIALDNQGFPHIGYGGEGALFYTFLNESGWQPAHNFSSYEVGNFSLMLDTEGKPHISYTGYFTDDQSTDHLKLYYAYQNESGWQHDLVDNQGWTHSPTSIALDQAGTPHISYSSYYTDTHNHDLKYATQNGASWEIQTVDKQAEGYDWDLEWFNSLAVDENGFPHISYARSHSDDADHDMNYAHLDVSGWHTQTVDTTASGFYNSLVLGEDSRPYISYSGNLKLKIAQLDTTGWQVDTVDSGGWIGGHSSLAVDSHGYPHIAYSALSLKYAYLDQYGWHTETIDDGRNMGLFTSLVLDKHGNPHISYSGYHKTSGYYPSDVKYAYRDFHDLSSMWQIETIDDEGTYSGHDRKTSLILDIDGNPHVSYSVYHLAKNQDKLRYAYKTDTGWNRETILTTDNVGNSSLALDSNGFPHITYDYEIWDAEEGVKYIYRDQNGWQLNVWNNSGNFSNHALALESNGIPHIIFLGRNFFRNSINHAFQYQDDWQIEQVAEDSCYGEACIGLDLDTQNYPHISVSNYDENLKYAYRDESGWHSELVSDMGWIRNSSLGLDSADNPHISFHYALEWDLMYAYRVSDLQTVTIRPLSAFRDGLPGTTVTYDLQVANRGLDIDDFEITAIDSSWDTATSHPVGILAGTESIGTTVQVEIPEQAVIGSSDIALITIASKQDPSNTVTAALTTYVAITTFLPLISK